MAFAPATLDANGNRRLLMTRPLRQTHLTVWLILAVLLPAFLIAALAARRTTTPRNEDFVWEKVK